jgi:hypothetical protein
MVTPDHGSKFQDFEKEVALWQGIDTAGQAPWIMVPDYTTYTPTQTYFSYLNKKNQCRQSAKKEL